MPLKQDIENRGQDTRRRILEAAMLRFAQHTYEETKLRDIAADVGVDVALVHRSFGSKEKLFTEVVNIAVQPQRLFAGERDELTARLTARIMEPSLDQALRVIDPLDILVRNLLSPEAIPLLREVLVRDVITPLVPKLDDLAPQRAALLAACLVGISIFRHVLRTEPLQGEVDDHLEMLIANIIDVSIGNSPAVPPPPSPKVSKPGASSKVRGSSRGRSS
ncbi:TetR/AcrR family transcriptional regulator [Pseudoroseomonas ludipueritiae]|uniref:TetR/AcrR family transcriptional regulator n=1 Tax=Pseudoroseomonas ludipueritiae TaxID=198093 RepID=A0ABR7R565_9PROT|nr:TetR/AcrR family transcriptional regulator [Pseudoroseomonas ludipueritiae]MBC9176819.1 TetR/AcrR family transcriptional regulator [Pseudoroseomonas ludipueritiae]